MSSITASDKASLRMRPSLVKKPLPQPFAILSTVSTSKESMAVLTSAEGQHLTFATPTTRPRSPIPEEAPVPKAIVSRRTSLPASARPSVPTVARRASLVASHRRSSAPSTSIAVAPTQISAPAVRRGSLPVAPKRAGIPVSSRRFSVPVISRPHTIISGDWAQSVLPKDDGLLCDIDLSEILDLDEDVAPDFAVIPAATLSYELLYDIDFPDVAEIDEDVAADFAALPANTPNPFGGRKAPSKRLSSVLSTQMSPVPIISKSSSIVPDAIIAHDRPAPPMESLVMSSSPIERFIFSGDEYQSECSATTIDELRTKDMVTTSRRSVMEVELLCIEFPSATELDDDPAADFAPLPTNTPSPFAAREASESPHRLPPNHLPPNRFPSKRNSPPGQLGEIKRLPALANPRRKAPDQVGSTKENEAKLPETAAEIVAEMDMIFKRCQMLYLNSRSRGATRYGDDGKRNGSSRTRQECGRAVWEGGIRKLI